MNQLPPGVERLLRLGVPADQRDPVVGDLQQEYAALVRRRGVLRATVVIWRQAAHIVWTFVWERVARGRPLPPIDDRAPRRITIGESMMQDVSYALRLLGRQPGFTAVAVLTLALGIGANTAILSVVDSVLWRPLPYPQAERIVSIAEQRPREGRLFGPVSPADFFDWRRDARSFSAMAAYNELPLNLTGAGEPERVGALAVSTGFLDVLATAPAAGRDFRLEEEMVGRHRVVLLTVGLWKRRFGAEPSIVGRSITLDGHPYEVVGILPPAVWWPTRPDVVVPLALSDGDRALRAAHFLNAVGRLAPGISMAEARGELDVIGACLSAAYPDENRWHAPGARSLRDALVGEARHALLVLLGAVAVVLLIACANVATLLLARAAGRRKELSVRRAVGATRGRLVRQMLTESFVISLIGGAAGVVIVLLLVSVALLASAIPSVRATRVDPVTALRQP